MFGDEFDSFSNSPPVAGKNQFLHRRSQQTSKLVISLQSCDAEDGFKF